MNSTPLGPTSHSSGLADFNFWMGTWRVKNRRLVDRLVGSNDWDEFSATAKAVALPGAIGNYDDFVPDCWRPGFIGMSLRIFNPATELWSIYWLDNQTGGLDQNGHLTPPVVGRFENGVGTFTGADTYAGVPILARYIWSDITEISAKWQQAFSTDNGKTWETNWVMQMNRIA
jgi:hypothetical protein